MNARHLLSSKTGKAVLTLLVLALLSVALHTLAWSNASFTDASSNPMNVFAAGTLAHTNSRNGQVVLDASLLRPGRDKTGTLTITGTGDVPGTYTLRRTDLVDTPASPGLSNTLQLRIRRTSGGATTLYDGSAAAFTSVSLGTIAPGVARTYEFRLTYPSGSANTALKGAAMALTLRFTGVTP